MSNDPSHAKRKVLETLALVGNDPDIAAIVPDTRVREAVNLQSLIGSMQAVFSAYAERPAIGDRAYQILETNEGRQQKSYLDEFTTCSYGQLQQRIQAIAAAWQHHPQHPVAADEMVCIMGFASGDFTVLDFACAYIHAVTVPLQSATSGADLTDIFTIIEPVTLAASISDLEICAEHAANQPSVRSLIAFDYDSRDESEREQFEAARVILNQSGSKAALISLPELIRFGKTQKWQQPAPHTDGDQRMAAIVHSSGSTGTPKGAVISEAALKVGWVPDKRPLPMLNIVSSPLNHVLGRTALVSALRVGGTANFTLMPDLSTLLDDIRIVRPIHMVFFPRILEMIYQHYQNEVVTRSRGRKDNEQKIARIVRQEMHDHYLGGRLKIAVVGGAPTSKAVMDFMVQCFDLLMLNGYGNTESGSGTVTLNGKIQRPPVIDYKLRDVPELGYYSTDKPYPRGEFCYKSTVGVTHYYKQPEATAGLFDEEGYSRTGDIVEERAPDRIVVVDRVKDVLKLSQGEYVAVGALATRFESGSPVIKQIYIYGNSLRAYLLAVVVPDPQAVSVTLGAQYSKNQLKQLIRSELRRVAQDQELKSFEVPREFLIEWQPFSQANGLLSSVRKRLRPALERKYGAQLEALYTRQENRQHQEYQTLRERTSTLSVIEKLTRLLELELKIEDIDANRRQSFAELGGDSLSAVGFSVSLESVFGVTIPANHILDPTAHIQKWANFIERELSHSDSRPRFDRVHGKTATTVLAADLTLNKFIDSATLDQAANIAPVSKQAQIVLLTGANGFLGHITCIEWLEKLATINGKLICLIRADSDSAARERLYQNFKGLDPVLESRFQGLANNHLEVLAGDIDNKYLGLKPKQFAKLAEQVDRICHVAALVNHRLSYPHLFGPNVVGTAEIIGLALANKRKAIDFVSTEAVYAFLDEPWINGEDAALQPSVTLSDRYASGYGASKWAAECLLNQASQDFALPVTIFRGDMMLAHQSYAGQINPSDMFTRLLVSVIKTGLAPGSFYRLSNEGKRQAAHYDGVPVNLVAAALVAVADTFEPGCRRFNVCNYAVDDGYSLDTFVDCIEEQGYPLTRVDDHSQWFRRFTEKLKNLDEQQRQSSALEIMDAFEQPLPIANKTIPCERFKALIKHSKVGPELPKLDARYITKCLNDMKILELI